MKKEWLNKLVRVVGLLALATALSLTGLAMADHVVNDAAPSATTNTSVPLGPVQPRPHYPQATDTALYGSPCQSGGNWGIINNCNVTFVGWTPSQINGLMLLAYVYGEPTMAFWECASQANGNVYTMTFVDCYNLLGNSSYSFPILQWWAHYNWAVGFEWTIPGNAYIGYIVG